MTRSARADPRATRIAVAVADTGPAWTLLDSGDAVAPRPVWSRGPLLRCALVGIRMMLLGDDHVGLHVEVGAGAALELVEPSGIVAHDAGGVASSLSMVVRVGDGGSFLYDGAPLVAATGADVTRSLTVVLGRDARALVRETSVRGRTGETGGRILSRVRVRDAVGDVLAEDLGLGTDEADLPGILPGVRTVDSTFAVGWDTPDLEDVPADATLRLDEPGGIVRALARQGERLAPSAGLAYTAWRASALAR